MNPVVSIIIPVFNAELYIKRCLKSVLNQTYHDFEIILVNDGSTDRSLKIIKEYQKKDHRIKVIDQNNKGTGEARNNGLENAQGVYILFVDADDTIESQMIEAMYNQSIKENSDIVVCEVNKVLPHGEVIKDNISLTSEKTFFSEILSFSTKSPVWNKLYKKTLFTQYNLCFPHNLKHNEDNAILFKLIYFAKKISFVKEYLYNWHIVKNSKSRSISKERLSSITDVLNIRYNFLTQQAIYETYEHHFITSVLILVDLRINNILNFAKDNDLISYLENIIDTLPFFSKINILKAKTISLSLYAKLLHSIIQLNDTSILLKYFPQDDVNIFKSYSSSKLGLLQGAVDQLRSLNISKFYIYGAGKNLVKLLPYLEQEYQILGIIDKNARNLQSSYKYPIQTLEKGFGNKEHLYIVISSIAFANEICDILTTYAQDNDHKMTIITFYSIPKKI